MMTARKAASKTRKKARATRKKAAPAKSVRRKKTAAKKRKVSKSAATKSSRKKIVARKKAANKAASRKRVSRKKPAASKKKIDRRVIKALAEFHRVLRTNPDFVEARVQLGLTYYTLGRVSDALEQWSSVLERDPTREDARMYLRLLKADDENS